MPPHMHQTNYRISPRVKIWLFQYYCTWHPAWKRACGSHTFMFTWSAQMYLRVLRKKIQWLLEGWCGQSMSGGEIGPTNMQVKHYSKILYCSALLCSILSQTLLHYSPTLYCNWIQGAILLCTILYCTILYGNVRYYPILYCTLLHYTAPHYGILQSTVLYFTALYYTVTCYIAP